MSHFPWMTWLEVHLLVMGTATGLVLIVADRRGYTRIAVAGGLLSIVSAMQLWVQVGWRIHPWYFDAPVAVTLAAYDLFVLPTGTDKPEYLR